MGYIISGGEVSSGYILSSYNYLTVLYGGTVNSTTVNEYGSLYVSSGGTANSTTVNFYGSMWVSSGGTATQIRENGGYIDVQEGANVTFASNTFSGLVLSRAAATIHSGTTANSNRVNEYGKLWVSSGGVADNTAVAGVSDDRVGRIYVLSGGVVNNTTVYKNGELYVSSGGTANSTTVYEYGYLYVSSGGTANINTVNANCMIYVLFGGVANSATVYEQGWIYVSSGGRLTGRMTFAPGAHLFLKAGSVIDFDLTQTRPDADALINDFMFIDSNPSFTLTVDSTLSSGYYRLADMVEAFSKTITVVNSSGTELGTLTVGGGTQTIGSKGYTLTLDGGVLGVTLDSVDTEKPTVKNTAASITTATNQNVTVTADFADDVAVASKLYRIGDGAWTDYADGVTVTENATVYFKAIDTSSNESEVVSYAVTNIDKIPPAKPTASADVTAPTNQNVTVTATFAGDSVRNEYSLDGTNWGPYSGGVIVDENGSVWFRATDEAGNVSEDAKYTVGNIDKVPPAKPTASADITAPTNQNVTVTATFAGDSVKNEYSMDGTNWAAYSGGVILEGNGSVWFRATDEAGNVSEDAKYTVENIDKVPPAISGIAADITDTTTSNVTVTANFADEGLGLASKQYRIGTGDWQDYTDGATVTSNATVYFKATDTAGNETTASYEVTNIGGGASAGVDLTGDLDTEYDLTFGKVGSSVNILSGGILNVDYNGSAEAVTVNPGGSMRITSTGTATQITENGGYVYLRGHEVTNDMFVPNEFSGVTLDDAWATLHSGTTATDTTIDYDGKIFVYSGGSANRTTVNTYGGLFVSSGGTVSQTTANFCAQFVVYSGGTAMEITENGGAVFVEDGATVTFVPNAFSGLVFNNMGVRATIHSGTTGTDLTFEAQDAGLDVYDGGIAKNITFDHSTELNVYSGGKVTGKMSFGFFTQVTAESGAILDFDLTQTAPDADALVDNLSLVMDQPFTYTLTVDNQQAGGTYKLAGNAAGFNKIISVRSALGDDYGYLTFGGTLSTGSSSYTLVLDADNTLSVDVLSKSVSVDTTKPFVTDIQASITTATNQNVTVTANFSDNVAVASKLYKIGDGAWTDYVDGVTVTENATVYFKAVDTSGNESDIASYVVTNIIPPVAPDLSGDLTASYDLTAGKVGHDVNILDGGELNVSDGGTVENTTVNNGGELNVSSGGKLTGKMTFENGATVTAETGAVFDFDLTQTTPGADALVKNLSLVLDQPFTYTITVDNTLDQGTYKLASGAEGFNKPVTLMSVYGENGGTYTVEAGTTKVGDAYITLALSGSDLTFTISEYNLQNKPDDGANDFLWTKKDGWNDTNILVNNFISGDREINLDERGTIDKDGKHNMFGNDGTKKDTGDVAKIDVNTPAKLTFTIDSTAAGTFYVYEDGFDKKGNRTQITVAKVSVKKDQTATLKDVCLTATGSYYVAMTAKNVKKAGTEGLYNVNVTTDKFFADADKGDNDAANDSYMVLIGRGAESKPILLDCDPMAGSSEYKNFVGFTDGKDYIKLDLVSSAYLKFNVTGDGDGKAKFTVWKQAVGTTGKLSKVTSVSLPAKKAYAATTKAQFLDTNKYTYYVSMECTDAAKGKGVYYNVAVTDDSVFFDSADNGKNDVLYDKKGKAFYVEDADHHFETTSIGGGTKAVKLDSDPVEDTNYENFVGYGDPADYAKIELTTSGDLYFKLKASGNATFTVYEKTQDKKGNDTLKAIQTTKLTLAKGKTTVEATTDLIADLAAGEYYVSMTAKSTKANASGSVFYNVTATLEPSDMASLAMPETSTANALTDTALNLTDSLSFSGYDADVLANASTSALAELDDKSAWQSLLA